MTEQAELSKLHSVFRLLSPEHKEEIIGKAAEKVIAQENERDASQSPASEHGAGYKAVYD
jgi:hypothetical protein